ncbi:MAG: CDP-alcohol phosphatidyltransferase family protein [Leptospirales bacterium]|nr:CDP-alcohol phosphatidyltransferase family protein [Leptospirales bacterium]
MNSYDTSIYYSILPLIIVSEIFILLFTYFAITWGKRSKSQETLSRLHKSFIGIFFIEYWYWITRPILNFFKLIKITPNGITAISILLSFATGSLYAVGFIALGGWLLIISGTLDMLDGALARETNQTTKSGAFFDSCGDRYSDAFVFIGIAIYFLSKNISIDAANFTITTFDYIGIVIIMTILLGTASMSYVKARGEVVGAATKRGLMQRTERVVMLSMYSVIDPFLRIILTKYNLNTDIVLIVILIIMSILINLSALVRMIDLFKIIKRLYD